PTMAHTGHEYYQRDYHSGHQKPLFHDDEYFRARAELALDYFTPAERTQRVFDYGCGLGASIALLPDAEGWDGAAEARRRVAGEASASTMTWRTCRAVRTTSSSAVTRSSTWRRRSTRSAPCGRSCGMGER